MEILGALFERQVEGDARASKRHEKLGVHGIDPMMPSVPAVADRSIRLPGHCSSIALTLGKTALDRRVVAQYLRPAVECLGPIRLGGKGRWLRHS